MAELKMEHILILVIVVFVLYHFMGRCQCNGFSVGGELTPHEIDVLVSCAMQDKHCDSSRDCGKQGECGWWSRKCDKLDICNSFSVGG